MVVPQLTYVGIDLTRACNLKCRHCRSSYNPPGKELNLQEIMKLIDQIVEYPTLKEIRFTGGEPTLREDLNKLIMHGKKYGIKMTLSSNGYFISEKLAQELVDSGLDSITISIDGLLNTHNFIRGSLDSYEHAIA